MNWRACIIGSLKIGATLLFVLVVSAAVWATLEALGDSDGAASLQGAVLVAAVCFALNFVALVVLLALAQIASTGESEEDEQ